MKNINDLVITEYVKLNTFKRHVLAKAEDNKGDFAMDHGVVTVICVALGAIILGLLILYFKGDFATNIKSKISNFFSQS